MVIDEGVDNYDLFPQPKMDGGIGYCSLSECSQYDGKRCRILGFRPEPICEPWVRGLAQQIEALENQNQMLIHRAHGEYNGLLKETKILRELSFAVYDYVMGMSTLKVMETKAEALLKEHEAYVNSLK